MAAPKTIIPAEVRDLIARAVAEPDVAVSEDLLRQADEWREPDAPNAPVVQEGEPVFEREPGQNWWRRVVRVWNRPRPATFH